MFENWNFIFKKTCCPNQNKALICIYIAPVERCLRLLTFGTGCVILQSLIYFSAVELVLQTGSVTP